jgi:hypothetical protein
MKKFFLALVCLGSASLFAMPPTHTFYDCSNPDGRKIVMDVLQGCFSRSYTITIIDGDTTTEEHCNVEDYADNEVLLTCGPHAIGFDGSELTLSAATTSDSREDMTCQLRNRSTEVMP